MIVIALAVSGIATAVNPAIAATTTKFVSEAAGRGASATDIPRIITGSLVTVAGIGGLLIGLAVLFGQPLSALVFGPRITDTRPDVGVVLFLAVASICLQQIDGVFVAALKGLEQFRRQAIVEMFARAVLASAVIAAAWIAKDVRIVLLIYCCVSGASSIARGLVVMNSLASRRLLSWPSGADFTRLLGFGGWMWLNAVATIAYSSADRIVIGRVAGSAAVAQFNVYVQLSQLVHFLPASLFSFSYPVFSRLGAQKAYNLEAIRYFYSRYLRWASGIGLALALAIVVCMHKLLYIVGGGAFRQQHDMVFILLVFGFLVLSFNVVPYCLALGLGRPRSVSLVTSVSMLGSIALTAFLTPALGLEGAALARLAYGAGALTLFFQAHRLLNSE